MYSRIPAALRSLFTRMGQWSEMEVFLALACLSVVASPVLWRGDGRPFFGVPALAWLWMAIFAAPVLYLLVQGVLRPAFRRLFRQT